MLLGPVKALYSMKFYLQGLRKSAWRASFFVFYIFALTAVITALFSIFIMRPRIAGAVDTLIDYMPEMTITNGVMEVNDNDTLKISPENMGGYNIVFDTGRTEPVYPTQMATDKTIILVGPDKLYFSFNGRYQETPLPQDLNANLDRAALNAAKEPITNMAAGAILAFMLLAQIFRVPFMLILAFIVMLILGKAMRVQTESGDNYKLACYVQAPAFLIYIISYFTPIPGFLVGFAYLAVFIIYGQLLFNAKRVQTIPEEPAESESAEQEEQDAEQTENEGDDSENN